VKPQILIPLVVTDHEVDLVMPNILAAGNTVCNQAEMRYTLEALGIAVGAMIETPRACIRADRIAACKGLHFVTIGCDTLTQLVFGLTREDAQQFMVRWSCNHACRKTA
jgi:pyruvate,orthophosphate dikinase